ncbi:NAD-dependent epimerase/dehydratase family protein [Sphingomonas sp.]|uniref:NAD-dependent epimerase/dehydratase family protein n=1 Tax=Sphingomonas sp. TaxID=28214 RepID=UPI0025DC1833|nr:NAD-dependent epimerase/dehydratase family protein [Sphingomonas sp.]
MQRVAILGAAGFIGTRSVEMLREDGCEVVPVVRRAMPGGVVADALDQPSLERAFEGCDAVVAAIAGPPATITGVCGPIVRAAQAAGVRRIVHLSSQAVHGQSLAEGTTEDSLFPSEQPFAYNSAKADAEGLMQSLTAAAHVEVVILRPGIVYGPRSRWTDGIADELLSGEAFLVRDAPGACNAVYVDNLVHAIGVALGFGATPEGAVFVNDAERLTWADLILPVADALGLPARAVRRPSLAEALGPASSWTRKLRPLRKLPGLRSIAPYSREMALLQSNTVHTSNARAERLLGYRPIVSHQDAMQRSIAWLRTAGYPVR